VEPPVASPAMMTQRTTAAKVQKARKACYWLQCQAIYATLLSRLTRLQLSLHLSAHAFRSCCWLHSDRHPAAQTLTAFQRL